MSAFTTHPQSFNYIIGLQLLFVAAGIRKISDGFGWIIQHRRTCKTYWVHTLGAILIALLLLQFAWSSFYDYTIPEWSFGVFLLSCATPLIYLFSSHLLFPTDIAPDHYLWHTYRSQIRLVAGLVIVAQIINTLLGHLLHSTQAYLGSRDIIRLVVSIALSGLFLPIPKYEILHKIVFVCLLLAFLVFALFLTPVIPVQP